MASNKQTFVAEVNLNGRPAINNLDLLQKSIKNLTKEAKRLEKLGKNDEALKTRDKMEEVKKVVAATKDEIKRVDSAFTTAGKSVKGLENALKLAVEKWQRLTDAGERNKMALRIREIKTELNKMNSTLDVTANKSRHAFGALAQLAAEYTGMYMLFNRSRQIITNAIQGNLKLSDSISDIQKVSGLSEDAVKGLVAQIEKLDSRNSPEVLNNMAYAAGKLGIKGAENLLGFTRAADKLNVALKEYLGDGADGVVKLMKFANVMGTSDQYGVEQALLKTGSALNYMTQSTAAAADYMIEFASRFGPIARQANMTEGDVIGLASALDALSVNNEEAATTLQRFVIKLLSSPKSVSKALGMDAEESKQLVETGRSIELVEQALGKLSERAEKYGVSGITSVIGDIGSKGQAQRLIKTLATLANNTEMVQFYVSEANKAFEEGTSVINEYNIKNQNAAAIMERMRNSWQKVMVNSANVGIVKEMATDLYNMSKQLQNNAFWMGQLKISIQVLFGALKVLIALFPSIITFLTTYGIARFVGEIGKLVTTTWLSIAAFKQQGISVQEAMLKIFGLEAAQQRLTVATAAQATATTGATAAQWGLNAAMAANVIGAIVALVGALVVGLIQLTGVNKDVIKSTTLLEEAQGKLNTNLDLEKMKLDDVKARLKAAKEGSKERRDIIAEINTKYKDYLPNLISEKDNYDKIKEALEGVNLELKKKLALTSAQQTLQDIQTKYDSRTLSNAKKFQSQSKEMGEDLEKIYGAQSRIFEIIGQNKTTSGKYTKSGSDITQQVIETLSKEQGGVFSRLTGPNAYVAQTTGRVRYDEFGVAEKSQEITKEELSRVESNRALRRAIYEMVSSTMMRDKEARATEEYFASQYGITRQDLLGGTTTTTTVLEPSGNGGASAKHERDEELEAAKKDVQAIKAQLTAFYEWRESEINKMRDEGTITEAVKKMMIDANKSMHAQSEMSAWKYLLGDQDADKVWEEQLQVMQKQILNSNPEMVKTWEYIGQVNMEALGSTLQRLESAEIGGMRKTIATDAAIIQKEAAKLAQAVQTELDKYDYEKTARIKFSEALTQMGLFTTKWEQGIRDGFESAAEAADSAMRGLVALGDKAFDFDIDTSEGIESFRTALSEVSGLALDTGEMTVDQLRLMYLQVIELSAQMDEANKKSYQHLKRQQDMRLKASGATAQEKQTDVSLEREANVKKTGIGQSLSEQIGLGSITEDPELQRIQNRIYWRQMEYEDAKRIFEQKKSLQDAELQSLIERGAQESEIENLRLQQQRDRAGEEALMQERETNYTKEVENLTAKIATEMKERADSIKKLITPVTDFTQAAGRKIGDMITGMESEEESWQALWKNMALAVGESVIQMGQQYAQNLMMQQMMAKQSEATAIEEAEVGTMAGIAEGSAKTIGKLGWWGIPLVAVISALLMGLLQSALSTKKKADTTTTSTKNNQSIRLVKGMLTYDEGNVQDFRQAREGGAYTVMGADGRIYSAHKQSELATGIVRRPTATLVNGQPSLVAERGPELIVGRKTLAAMTQFRPDLVEQIIRFDHNRRRGFRLYDEGNLDELGMGMGTMGTDRNGETTTALIEALQESRATNEQTLVVLSALTAEIHKGIGVRKYGTGGLVDEVIDGLYTTKKRNTSPMLRRLLGT